MKALLMIQSLLGQKLITKAAVKRLLELPGFGNAIVLKPKEYGWKWNGTRWVKVRVP